jgi:exodeoxyribonuclease VII small subunit
MTTPTADPAEEPKGYSAALAELEHILRELDGEDVDVDVLGDRVRRASELLRFCRDRITNARFEVEQVVAELEPEVAETAETAESPEDDRSQRPGPGEQG